MQIFYGDIFKNAWRITLRHKILWFFGLFASFLSFESIFEIIGNQIQQTQNLNNFWQTITNTFAQQMQALNQNIFFLDKISQDPSAYFIFTLALLLIIFFLWLVFSAQIYIIKYAVLVYKNKKVKPAAIFRQSQAYFWKVFGINILSKLLIYAGFVILSLPLLYLIINQQITSLIIADILFLLLYIISAIIISFLTAYAVNFIILRDLHIFQAISAAWDLFASNIIISFEIAAVLFLLKIASFIIALCIFVLVLIPLFIIYLIAVASGSVIGLVMSLTLIILALLIIYFLSAAIFTVFYLSSWAIAFTRLSEEPLLAKLTHLLAKLPGLFRKTAKKYNVDIKKEDLQKHAMIIAKKTQAESKVIAQQIASKYIELKPEVKKQSKVMAKKIKAAYIKYKPRVAEEIKKIILQQKRKNKIASQTKKTAQKKSSKKKKAPKK
ncbi:MAG: hypothetical protein WC460_01975 [Patescibacteria group bacterium]